VFCPYPEDNLEFLLNWNYGWHLTTFDVSDIVPLLLLIWLGFWLLSEWWSLGRG